jgi:hypothetical protein
MNVQKVEEIKELVEEVEELLEEVEIEEFVKAGKKVPKAKAYRIRVDREKFLVHVALITGLQLLELVKKSPDKWRIHQKLHGGEMIEIKPGETVDLRARGVERFVTMELTQSDGEAATAEAPPARAESKARRAFRLPQEDELYLNSLGIRWETVEDKVENKTARWLLLHDHAVPVGYQQRAAVMAIRIETGYPPAKLDMVYFHPALSRDNGRAIHSLATQEIEGVIFQRWSRHYEWREEVDCLATHHLRIKQWLTDELAR